MNKAIIFLLVLAITGLASCSKYLDQIPDETLKERNLFDSKDDMIKVLTQVYAYYENPIEFRDNIGMASDEADYNWSNYSPNYKDNGAYSPSNPIYNRWGGTYQSIRTALYFLNRIDECKDEKLTEQERTWWKGEAEFLIAYYYFQLLTNYGPVPIVDKVYSETEMIELLKTGVPRNSFNDVVKYIDGMLVKAAEKLDPIYAIPDRAGRANITSAKFLRSRLMLYAASPLYNGMQIPGGKKLLADMMIKDNKGDNLLNDNFDAEKWKTAMTVTEDAIDFANKNYFLMMEGVATGRDQGLYRYKRLFTYPRGGEPNKENIFYKQNYGTGDFNSHALPISWSRYTGVCPTMEHVSEYFMANGLMPEDDPDYMAATGFEPYEKDGFNVNLYKKFKKRDPRFYANILFPEQYSYAMLDATTEKFDAKWAGDTDNKLLYFRPYYSGQDGFKLKPGRDFCTTGFLCIKYMPVTGSKSNQGDNGISIFRYTELLLNYIEAATEYAIAKGQDPFTTYPKIQLYWDQIRNRVGIPSVIEAYQKAGIAITPSKARELVHRERNVELAFEGHRYFDNRRWLIAENEGGPKHGFNIQKDGNDFWDPTYVFETRYWDQKMYFNAIPQVELNKNIGLTQNPRW